MPPAILLLTAEVTARSASSLEKRKTLVRMSESLKQRKVLTSRRRILKKSPSFNSVNGRQSNKMMEYTAG